ncbi:MAG: hypothetical protein Q4E06_13240, partial [Lautropia sp.]|nr:hypothetical protein [Lautropia sp.]
MKIRLTLGALLPARVLIRPSQALHGPAALLLDLRLSSRPPWMRAPWLSPVLPLPWVPLVYWPLRCRLQRESAPGPLTPAQLVLVLVLV